MKKIAFIIVRYGENINGGAEVHCQMLAERLLPYYEVEVLTTTIRASTTRIRITRKVSVPGTASPYAVSSRSPSTRSNSGPSAKNTRPHAVSGNT